MSFSRILDDVGRISIPKDVRRRLFWMAGDEIEVEVNPDESITLRKGGSTCLKEYQKILDTLREQKEIGFEDVQALDKAYEVIKRLQN